MKPLLESIGDLIKGYLSRKAATVNHSAIIKDVYQEVEISAGYLGILTLANLIALCGLLQNSVPVIIGAMLISPLMGPILSFGFAFITGDRSIWWKSVKIIALSVGLTVVIAAIAAFLSPLKDMTAEIAARTRPNLYDLLIAFFSGFAGAVAICTKKRYLTIVPGVAIATAVIPPLSVTGYGLGIADFRIMAGSFLMFFTNFVAIVISTCGVFYFYGFRPRSTSEEDMAALKKRMVWLAVVLMVISIPLIYTLQKSISEVRLRTSIKQALRLEFDMADKSRMAGFTYKRKERGRFEIDATVNVVRYLEESDIRSIEKRMEAALGHDLTLYVEQIKVQQGGLKNNIVKPGVPASSAPNTPSEILSESRIQAVAVVRNSILKIERIISPSNVAEFSISFNDSGPDVSIALKIRRDSPLSGDATQLIKGMFEADINMPVSISVVTVPFVPELVFRQGEVGLSADMKKTLAVIKEAYAKDKGIRITAEAWPESGLHYGERIKLARLRLNALSEFIEKEYSIPERSIRIRIGKYAVKKPVIKIKIGLGQTSKR